MTNDLKNKIREDMKSAMRNKDMEKVQTLRGLLAAFTNELVAQKRPPTEDLSEADMIKVLKRAAKQRKDSIEQFTKGGRKDLADKEQRELEIIEQYLPKMAGAEEIEKVVREKIEKMNCAGDMSKMGMIMGAVMKEFGSNADGNEVKEIVQQILTK